MDSGAFGPINQHDAGRAPRQFISGAAEQVRLVHTPGFFTARFAERHFSNYSFSPSPLMAARCAPQTRRGIIRRLRCPELAP